MNSTVKNVVLVMSGGSGQRFGAPVPKQYCMMGGREIISYAIDAARFCPSTDEVVIVTAEDYLDSIREKYGFPTTLGGSNRTESLANGLAYIAENYDCEKVIIVNAVCPLMTEEQLDRYFKLLDDYDYVLTSWKVVSTLHRYDGTCVDRNDYFHVMEPEAYRFKMLYETYRRDYPVPYNFHQLPKTAKGFFCFDYPYTMKITYSLDVKIAELLYNEIIARPKQEKIKQTIVTWLSSFSPDGIVEWMSSIPQCLTELADKWQITSWRMNPKTFVNCVFEAESRLYGGVIIKFFAPNGRYELEKEYYRKTNSGRMATLLDNYDPYHVLLIKKILPAMQVPFNVSDRELRTFYDDISQSLIPYEPFHRDIGAIDIMEDLERNISLSDGCNFHLDEKHALEAAARQIWKEYFADSPMYLLHRDLHRRNVLRGLDGVRAIDPMGVIGPREFEYSIVFVVEEKANRNRFVELHKEILDYFSKYCDKKRLLAAVFILWIHKMDEYVFSKNDGCALAEWSFNAIRTLFFAGKDIKQPCALPPVLQS